MSTAILEMPTNMTGREGLSTVPAGVERVVLTGFMGSGKTSVGGRLAERLGWKFLDLDREIERRDGRPVPAIFAESGEAHFRHLETAALASLLGERRVVVALGGGAPEELGNRLLLEQTPRTAVVYLTAPFRTLVKRCAEEAEEAGAVARPVLSDAVTAELRFRARQPHYERIASHRVDTSELAVDEAVEAVLEALRRKK
jgi:shikimate kinase